MFRVIVTPESDEHILSIPVEYVNTQVEILVFPFSLPEKMSNRDKNIDIFAKTAGILNSQNIDPLVWQDGIREEWDR